MEPESKKPITIAGVAVFLFIVVFIKGSPLIRFQLITALVARWRNNQPAGAAVSANRPPTVYTSFRQHWLIVAILGRPVSISTPDVEQANTAPPVIDLSMSTPTPPPPAYMQRHIDEIYTGVVTYLQPWIHNAPGPGLVAVAAPPAYSSSSSLPRTAPGMSTPSS